MEIAWNADALQEEYRRRERMKHDAAEDCRRKARAGAENYRYLHDQERAEQMVAMFLKTTAALACRESLLEYLTEMREGFRAGRRDDKTIFDTKTYRRAAVASIDQELRRFKAS